MHYRLTLIDIQEGERQRKNSFLTVYNSDLLGDVFYQNARPHFWPMDPTMEIKFFQPGIFLTKPGT